MIMVRIFAALCLCLVTALPVQAAAGKKLTLAYVEWDCSAATSYLAKAALKDRLGIDVDLVSVTAAAMWASVASGDADASLAAWLPATHGSYAEKLKGRYDDLGPLVAGVRLGWAVPDYVPITSIREVGARTRELRNTITGIDAGAGLMILTEKAMEAYGLTSMILRDGSGATMTAALGEAIRRKEWIVVTAWSPHWMFGRWKLRYLEDPEGALGGQEAVHTIARKGLQAANPQAYAFLNAFHYENISQLETLMTWNQKKGADLLANARRFMRENPALVDSWFGTQAGM